MAHKPQFDYYPMNRKNSDCKSNKGMNFFTLKEYKKNEDYNEHTFNALLLVKKFGTKVDIKKMQAISNRNEHSNEGMKNSDYKVQYELHNKYFKCFFKS